MNRITLPLLLSTAALASCTSSIKPTDGGELANQLGSSAKDIIELKKAPKASNNPTQYSLADLTNAYKGGFIEFPQEFNTFYGASEDETRKLEEFAIQLTKTFEIPVNERNYHSPLLDSRMRAYAQSNQTDVAIFWVAKSAITEPLSFAIWTAVGQSLSNGGSDDYSLPTNETIGTGKGGGVSSGSSITIGTSTGL